MRVLFVLCLTALIAACATPPWSSSPGPSTGTGTAPSSSSSSTRAAPRINLAGFPPEFKQGYADGCDSAGGRMKRDPARYSADPQYAQGWRDGNDMCKSR